MKQGLVEIRGCGPLKNLLTEATFVNLYLSLCICICVIVFISLVCLCNKVLRQWPTSSLLCFGGVSKKGERNKKQASELPHTVLYLCNCVFVFVYLYVYNCVFVFVHLYVYNCVFFVYLYLCIGICILKTEAVRCKKVVWKKQAFELVYSDTFL